MAIPMKQAIQNALGLNSQAVQNQCNSLSTPGGSILGSGTYTIGGSYSPSPYPSISPQHLPDPQEVKKNFEEYLKRYLSLYSGMYTNPYEKELIENLRGLLVLDKVKSL